MPPATDPTSEPAWMQRMRAAGYDLRRGTLLEPLSEIPEVMFTPPPPETTEPQSNATS
jgi:hypothetical protein